MQENDRKAFAVIEDLGLKDGQLVSEEDLLTVVKAYYGDCYPAEMSDLINSIYFKTVYVIDLKAKPKSVEISPSRKPKTASPGNNR